ncbi:MAG: TRAM domain-containing protein, partial [Clostridia bacterium]|nr:TRAM domain-containing protein [Clostridia bacterium]
LLCTGVTLLFALLSWFLAPSITKGVERYVGVVEGSLSETPVSQLLSAAVGLVLGLSIAALATQLFRVSVPEMFFVSVSAFVYLLLGYLGASIGFKRWREMPFIGGGRLTRAERKSVSGAQDGKVLDTSVIIDGRIFDILKTGFVEGPLVVPQFVLAELQHIADSSDPLRRTRGRRGLDILSRIQRELDVTVHITDVDFPGVDEVDVKLLKFAKQTGCSIVTNDFNLNKVADVTGVKVLNINDLAGALRPVLLPGEEMAVQILREGKEAGQGVGFLDDGTMIVVDNGKRYIGETVEVVVTSMLQTSAGRLIFARIKQGS